MSTRFGSSGGGDYLVTAGSGVGAAIGLAMLVLVANSGTHACVLL